MDKDKKLAMSCAPIIFSRRCKKNPFADRGLAEFALISAELEAKRKKLLVQLGTPLSFVRFASGSDHREWIPIIICPTLSAEKIRTLRRAATDLISEDRSAKIPHTGSNAERSNLTKIAASAQNHPSDVNPSSHTRASVNYLAGKFAHTVSAAEKLLWMAAFGLSIVADIVRNFLRLETRRVPDVIPLKRRPNLSKQEISHKHNPSSATIPSDSHHVHIAPSLTSTEATPTSMLSALVHTKRRSPPHPLHIKPLKAHISWENSHCSTAPSTPTNSRQHKKPFHTSVSLPKACALEEGVIDYKGKELRNTISLPKTTHLQESEPHRGSNSTVKKVVLAAVERKEKTENLNQALTGTGVVLGLSGLVMGYLPAVVSIVCFWYLLPTLRKAMGDKPTLAKSQHHKKKTS